MKHNRKTNTYKILIENLLEKSNWDPRLRWEDNIKTFEHMNWLTAAFNGDVTADFLIS
jgi:hypothetical protein